MRNTNQRRRCKPSPAALAFLKKLEKAKNELQPLIKENDLVWIRNTYFKKPYCYEVVKTDDEGLILLGNEYVQSWIDVISVFRFDGTDYKCIWRAEDEVSKM